MNIHKPVEEMTLGYFIQNFIVGLIMWPFMLLFAFLVPVVGWVMIPMALVWPIAHPFAQKAKDKKEWKNARKQAVEDATFKKLVPQK